jgi:hypothetical protein
MRVPVIALVLVVCLGFLFGARWVYQNQALNRPLEQAIGAVPGVLDVAVTQRSDALVVRVRVGETPRLEEFVSALSRVILAVEGDQRVELRLSDSRTESLQDVYYDFHFHLQEAAATGRYSALPARLEEVAASNRLTRYRVFVGPEYVYVQLHQEAASFYEILPRDPGRSSPSAASSLKVTVCPWEG